MALRLSSVTTQAPAGDPVALGARAKVALQTGDLVAWRALWTIAGALEDRHARHLTRLLLTESVLGQRDRRLRTTAPGLAALAGELLGVLREEPREPSLLNHAGVAFYELGALAAAEPLFTAALRLDPSHAHAADNLEHCARRRRSGLQADAAVGPAVTLALRELAPMAKRVAAAAQPATGLTLALCMIVRDEEAMLGRCLAAARDAVDEIIVVDTGSVDGTIAIAESYGARILHHTWTGDFGAARNVSFDAASTDWLLYLDADEVLHADDARALHAVTARTWREAFYLVETNHTGDMADGTAVTHDALRVFRNRPEYRFEGRIHEQIAHRLPGQLPDRLERTSIRLEHFGYLGAVRDAKGKSQRNLELLETQLREQGASPFLRFNLGSEHLAANNPAKAAEYFAPAWAEIRDERSLALLGYAPSLASRLVKALRASGRLDEADRTAAEALQRFEGFTDIVFEQGHVARVRGDRDAAATLFERCLAMGDAPSRYSAQVGCGSHLAQLALGELRRDAGRLEEAEELLRAGLRATPAFAGAAEALAGVLLKRGLAPDHLVAAVADAAGEDLGVPSRFVLAIVLYEAGHVVQAEALLRGVVEAQPTAGAPRVALAEALLSQGRLAEAAATARAVDPDAPARAAALRTELFAVLADGGQPDAATLEAARGRLDPGELAAFAAWAGRPVGPVPAVAAAGPVLVMLDALARLERFEAFEALERVLQGSELGDRERSERLAQLYLRRGFLASAADEWFAVCERQGPDVAALDGLSRVARAQGLDEDADIFAAEAAALG